jgi:hypothetical protein
MIDIEIQRDPELMVASVVGKTEAGDEFVDAIVLPDMEELYVHDAGVVIVREHEIERLAAEARAQGLNVEVDVTERFKS